MTYELQREVWDEEGFESEWKRVALYSDEKWCRDVAEKRTEKEEHYYRCVPLKRSANNFK